MKKFPLVFPFLLLLLASMSSQLPAADPSAKTVNPVTGLKYKVISGYKQPFNDDLQFQLSKGWTPVGGVSVTTWNNALFFAQLLSKHTNQP